MTQVANPRALTPEMQTQLENLKDIYLPEAVSWWPLAMGWWILIALLVAAIGIGCYFLLMRKRQSFKKNILAELHAIPSDDEVKYVSELSALLRRVAIYYENNYQVQFVQNLSGKAWAEFLSRGEAGIPEDLATHIANVPYANKLPSEINTERLRQASELWILKTIRGDKS